MLPLRAPTPLGPSYSPLSESQPPEGGVAGSEASLHRGTEQPVLELDLNPGLLGRAACTAGMGWGLKSVGGSVF